jgi:Helix-turn-helix
MSGMIVVETFAPMNVVLDAAMHRREAAARTPSALRRMMLGRSQTQLGEALGIAFQQVQKYEKGANRISASRLQHISEILQVEVPFFFERGRRAPCYKSALRLHSTYQII